MISTPIQPTTPSIPRKAHTFPNSTPVIVRGTSISSHVDRQTQDDVDPSLVAELAQNIQRSSLALCPFLSQTFQLNWDMIQAISFDSSVKRDLELYQVAYRTARKETDYYDPFITATRSILTAARRVGIPILSKAHYRRHDAVPVLGSKAQRKPDGVLTQTRGNAALQWSEVLCPIEFRFDAYNAYEVKPKSLKSLGTSNTTMLTEAGHEATNQHSERKLKDHEQLTSYVLEMQSFGAMRRHAFGLLIEGRQMEVCFYDKSGAIRFDRFDLFAKKELFVAVIVGLAKCDFSTLRFHDFFSTYAIGEPVPSSLRGCTVICARSPDGSEARVALGECVNARRGLFGRMTALYRCNIDGDPFPRIFKLSSQLVTRNPEHVMIRLAQDAGVSNISEVHAWWQSKPLSQGIRGQLLPEGNYEDRIYRGIVMTECFPLHELSFHDYVRCLKDNIQGEKPSRTSSLLRADTGFMQLIVTYISADTKFCTETSVTGI
jgi:hypothetical protein